jgi:pantoate--beta-alanine ligase
LIAMQTIETVTEVREFVRRRRCEGRRIGLVPTMGALHAGHLALVDHAARRADVVVVSVFVNPTQFGPGEDFDRYPRPVADDLALLDREGISAVFLPSSEEMYPSGAASGVRLVVGALSDQLCGRYRPGHFDGVVQIVAKLFAAIEPDVAVFGLKDAQQFVIIEHLVAALGFGVEIDGVETVREPDGLAMSSRNRYLNPSLRGQAVVLNRALASARACLEQGEQAREPLVTAMLQELRQAPDFAVQYAEMVDARTLQPLQHVEQGQRVLFAIAGHLDSTRLIDSAFVTAP